MRWVLILMIAIAQDPRTKDPTKCTAICVPSGYDKELPEEFPEGVPKHTCEGACASYEPEPGDKDACKPHHTCTVYCSEVCCVCLRECI